MTTVDLNMQTRTDVLAAWTEAAYQRAARAGEPEWAIEQRRAAATVAARLPMPNRSMELWRRTDFGSL